MDFRQHLNPQQWEAVRHEGGPLLILAGAGSGKTRVLTYRIAHLMQERQRDPSRILAITFTNKAAEEMRSRVAQLLGTQSRGIWIGTFHATCARILRRHAGRLGLQANFVIYDESDQLHVIRDCLKRTAGDDRRLQPQLIRSMIDRAKNRAVDPVHLLDPASATRQQLELLFTEYERRLREANAMDFGDLICCAVRLLGQCPEVRAAYRELFRSVLVDEYQDTNRAQHLLLQQLVTPGGDLCVVGDDDQSIYRWRGAEINNMLDFESDFPGARVLTLEQNYRSTQTILSAASEVAKGNPKRREKRLWTENEPGEPIRSCSADSPEREAEFIAAEILALVRSGEVSFRDVGILFRTNAQSRPFEDCFVLFRIPYVVVGSLRFYERAEIKDLLAYLRLLYNPRDSVSLLRILNRPPRGIGPATQEALEAYALQTGLGVWDALQQACRTEVFSGAIRTKLRAFREQAERLLALVEEARSLGGLLKKLLEQTAYSSYLETQPDGERRLENVEELVRTAVHFEQACEQKGLPELLGAFCERVALITNVDQSEGRTESVTLMTLHCAKGLEFPVVFLTGMEYGLVPHQRSTSNEEDLAEERRLCYVGMTRARKRLYLSRARTRTFYGERQPTRPSPFLTSIPSGLMVAGGQEGFHGARLPESEGPGSTPDPHRREAPPPFAFPELSAPPAPRRQPAFAVGDAVEHESLGRGIVRKVTVEGEKEKIVVEFQGGRIRKLMAGLAPIRKLP